MKRSFTLAVLAAIAAVGIGFSQSQPGQSTFPSFVGAAHAEAIQEMVLGNPDAKVEVIEYASFTCGHCANFSQTVLKDIKKDYIDTGKIKFVHRDVYFDRYGLWASMVARCDPMRYFGISDLLFKDISAWASGEPAQIADNLRKIGRTAGLSNEQVNACLQDAEMAQDLVAWYEGNAKEHDISATPSFVINGEKYSNMNYADFSKVLDEKLGE
ncbi:protein-disulfide isomerase [Aliiruegeria haliotis]|uniref:Protein-disulfide isomerase n=1 Tax=Aliiruegeria haliotis TaxID=1280846 RepID=A0A2T0RID9_9RHOB|nr:DsbA family protein [Aliiruegeria haliotis]PRY20919.1 protein-disulfide isomerase [Aliiruegeria haliotis]